MREHAIERSRPPLEIEGPDEHGRVLDVAAAADAHEAPQLCLEGAAALRGLALEGPAVRARLGLDDPLDRGGAEAADQLVLEVQSRLLSVEDRSSGPDAVSSKLDPSTVGFLGGVALTDAR